LRRILLAVTMATVMAAMLALNSGYAFAISKELGTANNPNFDTTPAADFTNIGTRAGACLNTAVAPPADGGDAPGSGAADGEPGWDPNLTQVGSPNGC
jgi:hypothetical protein